MLQDLRNRPFLIGGIIAFLILANIISYIWWNWGLITVKVTDAPLAKVIRSIEWQGWVTIYTNLPPDTKVSMYVDHVPLADAMETLSANVTMPRPATPPGGANLGAAPNFTGAPGGQNGGQRPGGGGRGGFAGGFGGAQWNLAFFTAPSSSKLKAEILAFEANTVADDTVIYNYPTPLQMLTTDGDAPVSDPRLQGWPGYKPPQPAPATPPPTPVSDSDLPAALQPINQQQQPAAANPDAAPTVQTYLQAMAQSANIWIMSSSSWAPPVSSPPSADSSIISAVKDLVGSGHGAVKEVLILRAGRVMSGQGDRGMRRGGGLWGDMDSTIDRMQNALNGLPPDDRADAQGKLDEEVGFFKRMQNAPPDTRFTEIRNHMMTAMADNLGGNGWRRSPEQRAQMMQRLVSNRQAAQGQK